MTATYTSSLRLTKQGDGDNPNSWGVVLNDGVISLVDDAIAGYTTVSLGSTATVTLSAIDGAGDVPRSAFLELKGSVGGVNNTISMIIPAQSKSYVINNKVSANTTASDVIKIKTASGDGYNIPSGAIGLVICDGTSVFATNTRGEGFGTAASADIGTGTTDVPDVSIADARYVRSSVTANTTVRGDFVVEAGSLKVATSARAYNVPTTLTDATSIAVDFALGNNFVVTLAGNRTLAAPSNAVAGQSGQIHIIQDSTGSRTLAYNSAYQFVSGTAPTLSTGASDVDILLFTTRSATTIDAALLKNFD